MSAALRVALLGFDSAERVAIKAAFAKAGNRRPSYVLVPDLGASDLLLADAEHMAAVQLVLATERLAETLFVGRTQTVTVKGAAAWVARPISADAADAPDRLLRELDALLAQRPHGQTDMAMRPAMPPPMPPALPPTTPAPDTHGMMGADRVQPDDTSPGAAPHAAYHPSAGSSAPLALVVDDSETARCGMTQRLQHWGFQVEQAAHSDQALALLAQRRFDSVFIDVNLGPASALDGFTLCKRLKRVPPRGQQQALWVALVTALNSPSDRVRGTLAGCDAYLTKPVDSDELARVLWVQGWAPPPPRLSGSPPSAP